jgi:hypothetical protein
VTLDIDEQELCKEKVEEIDPNIRLCRYKLTGSSEDASKIVEMSLASSSNPAFDLIKSKLEVHIFSFCCLGKLLMASSFTFSLECG